MTKFTKAILLAAALIFAPLSAAQADNDIGCGVGTEIFKGQAGPVQKILASLTNGFTFQSISITFGLVNCNGQNKVTADAADLKVQHFAAENFDRLSVEMAQGGGEHLDVLAGLMAVEDREAFAAMTQTHFEALFPSDQTTVGEMLSTLDQLIASS